MNWLPPLLALFLAPLLLGVINRTKAFFAGRKGQPLLQSYFDLTRLLRKGAVYSSTTSWILRAGPILGLAAMFTTLQLVPFGGQAGLLHFSGDLVLLCGLLALGRFVTIAAALDTGSSFEGMGASREALFGALAEPALYLSLAAVVRHTGSYELSSSLAALAGRNWVDVDPSLVLVTVALLAVFLVENCRIPVDDPNTHLELTMIHEVMVLDHSGPDLAFILYGAALKMWILAALLFGIALPALSSNPWLNLAFALVGVFGLALLVGVIESVMARLRMVVVPQLLVVASALAATALLLGVR